MAASLMNMLDDLELRLERTQAELQALREENQRLKQQLEDKAVPVADTQSENSSDSLLVSAQESARQNPANNEIENPAGEEAPFVEEAAPVEAPPIEAAPIAIASAAPTLEPETPNKAEVTPVIKAEKPKSEAAQLPSPNALLNSWYERYPKAFFKGHTKPLKVGIHQDLAEREEWPNKLIRRALANYVNLPRYIKAVRAGAERVDLDGLPAGKVDKEAASHAAEKRSDQQVAGQPVQNASATKKTEHQKQRKAQFVANKPRPEGVKQSEPEKREPRKQLSLEDKLIGLQQKFKGR